jgi:hypothetical protein
MPITTLPTSVWAMSAVLLICIGSIAVPVIGCVRLLPVRWARTGLDPGASKTIARFLAMSLLFFFPIGLLTGPLLGLALRATFDGAPRWIEGATALMGYFLGFALGLGIACVAAMLLARKLAERPAGRFDPGV